MPETTITLYVNYTSEKKGMTSWHLFWVCLTVSSICLSYSSVLTCDSFFFSIRALNLLITVILNSLSDNFKICVAFWSSLRLLGWCFSLPLASLIIFCCDVDMIYWTETGGKALSVPCVNLGDGLYFLFTAAVGARGFKFLSCPCFSLPWCLRVSLRSPS